MSTKQSNNTGNSKTNTTFKTGQKPQVRPPPRPLTCKQVNVNKIKIGEVKSDGDYCKFQSMAFVSYDDNKFLIQTPWFNISQYGVSQLGDFVKEESQRMTLKLPLDSQEGCVELANTFGKIDAKLEKDKSINLPQALLEDEDPNDISTQFQYKSIVRKPQKETAAKIKELKKKWADAGKDWNKRTPKCEFWKAKLDVDYTTKKIMTPIFWRDSEEATATKHMPANADDLLDKMPFGSKVRMVVEVSRYYAEKSAKGEGQPLKFGVALKIKQIDSIRKVSGGGGPTVLEEYAFVDENADENTEGTTNEATEVTNNDDNDNDDASGDDNDDASDDDDASGDDDGDDDQEPAKPVEPVKPAPVAKPVTKPAAKPTPVRKTGK